MNEFTEFIAKKEIDINMELFNNYFDFRKSTIMLNALYILNARAKNNQLVNRIKKKLTDLKKETENMSKEEKEIENIDRLIDIVEKILEFNKKNKNKKEKA